MPTIEFLVFSDLATIPPEPMMKHLPDWYKNLDAYIGGKKGIPLENEGHSTMKKCIPVLDSLGAGYMMFTQVDYITEWRNGVRHWWWSTTPDPHKELVVNHSLEAVAGHPMMYPNKIPWKFESPWGIRTPKGWSTLFIPPLYRDEPIFEIIAGIVDTDSYHVPVNHPFFLTDDEFEGHIPAGTPLAQIIPIKRDDWKSKIIDSPKEREMMIRQNHHRARFFWNGYKRTHWDSKSYK